jgi:hypothetical protein
MEKAKKKLIIKIKRTQGTKQTLKTTYKLFLGLKSLKDFKPLKFRGEQCGKTVSGWNILW